MQRVTVEAFLLGEETAKAVEAAFADRRLMRARLKLQGGGCAAAVEHYAELPTPDVLVVESVGDAERMLADLESLAGVCQPETRVVLFGSENDVALYRRLKRQGISEYLPVPTDAKHVAEVLVGLCAEESETRLGRLISFIGAAGGSGSSQIAHNTAFQLARLYDAETAVLDLDLAFGTAGLGFNIESPQSVGAVLAEPERIDDSLVQRVMAKYNENLYLLTSAPQLGAAAEITTSALDTLLRTVRRNTAFVVVDLPSTWTPWVHHVLNLSDEVVVAATPRLHALKNAKQVMDLLNPRRPNDAPVRLLLNRTGASPKTELGPKDFVTALGQAPALTFPYDPATFEVAANNGTMIGEVGKAARTVEMLTRLATMVSGRQPAKPQRRGLADIFRFPKARAS